MNGNLSPEEERRVYNLIWTGAKEYDFEPDYIANDIKGDPDFYMNLIIGLAYKKFGKESIKDLFSQWENTVRRNEFDLLAWFAIESYIYSDELKVRPVLEDLRLEYAENFQNPSFELQRRRLSFSDNLVYRMYDTKTNLILERNISTNQKDYYLFSELTRTDFKTTDEFKKHLISVFKEKLHLGKKDRFSSEIMARLSSNLNWNLTGQVEYSIRANRVKESENTNELKGIKRMLFNASLKRKRAQEEEIAAIYGESMFSEKERIKIDEEYCIGNHSKSHLWFTRGEPYKGRYNEKLKSQKADIENQIRKNIRKFESASSDYNRQIRELAGRIKRSLKLTQGTDDLTSRKGKLIGKLAWKSLIPDETKIFKARESDTDSDFSVDLLLDASASRIEYQEEVAIEAYIIASSLVQCNIQVRVISYNTIRNYTILRILKNYDNNSDLKKIFTYFASGWNRDGLAYRGYLNSIKNKSNKNNLTIILTDANPNDLMPIGTGFSGKAYEGKIGLEDTKEALSLLRKKRNNHCAVITGEENSLENAKQLFNNRYVKISTTRQIAICAGKFIERELKRMKGNSYLN